MIVRWYDNAVAMVRFVVHYHTIAPSRSGSMQRWRDGAMPRWYDGDDGMTTSLSFSRHCTIVIANIALSTFLHIRCLKKMATWLHCRLQLLWFIYHQSNILHACTFYDTCFKCLLAFKINATRTDSWKYNHSIMYIRYPPLHGINYRFNKTKFFRWIPRQKKHRMQLKLFW